MEVHLVTLNACFKRDEVNRMVIPTRPFPCPALPPHQQFLSVSTAIQITGTQNKALTSVLSDDQPCTVGASDTHYAKVTLCVCSDVSMLIYNKSLSPMFKDYELLL
jgi:hypothetical protein